MPVQMQTAVRMHMRNLHFDYTRSSEAQTSLLKLQLMGSVTQPLVHAGHVGNPFPDKKGFILLIIALMATFLVVRNAHPVLIGCTAPPLASVRTASQTGVAPALFCRLLSLLSAIRRKIASITSAMLACAPPLPMLLHMS